EVEPYQCVCHQAGTGATDGAPLPYERSLFDGRAADPQVKCQLIATGRVGPLMSHVVWLQGPVVVGAPVVLQYHCLGEVVENAHATCPKCALVTSTAFTRLSTSSMVLYR